MGRYVRSIKTEHDFDGQKAVVFLKPLTLEDMLSLRVETNEEATRSYARMLPRYIDSISGVTDCDDKPVPIDEICAITWFLPLLASIMKAHIEAAQVPDPTSPAAASAASSEASQ